MAEEVLQAGLFSEDPHEVKQLVERVAKFNQRYTSNVKLDLLPMDKGDAQCERPHVKIYIHFPSHEVQDAFWTE